MPGPHTSARSAGFAAASGLEGESVLVHGTLTRAGSTGLAAAGDDEFAYTAAVGAAKVSAEGGGDLGGAKGQPTTVPGLLTSARSAGFAAASGLVGESIRVPGTPTSVCVCEEQLDFFECEGEMECDALFMGGIQKQRRRRGRRKSPCALSAGVARAAVQAEAAGLDMVAEVGNQVSAASSAVGVAGPFHQGSLQAAPGREDSTPVFCPGTQFLGPQVGGAPMAEPTFEVHELVQGSGVLEGKG